MAWLRKFGWLAKLLVSILLLMGFVLLIGHFGLQYGIEAGAVPAFLERTWLLWLVVRWVMYGASGYFLWKLYKLAENKTDDDRLAVKKLITAAIIAAVFIELVTFSRLMGD